MTKLNLLKQELKKSFSKSIEKTITKLEEIIAYESEFYDDIIMLYSQYKRLNKAYHIQIINFEKFNIESNKIAKGVLNIIKYLEEDDLKIYKNDTEKIKKKDEPPQLKEIEFGVYINGNNKHSISIAPTVFFSERIALSFPGIRGVKWFEGKKAIYRLLRLLKNPCTFHEISGYGADNHPIYWFRGFSTMYIEAFTQLSSEKCLMNSKELIISKIAVYTSDSYYKHLVYVEILPDSPIGVYSPLTKENKQLQMNDYGYIFEEYGLFKETPIKRTEYDDGAAEIEEKIVDTFGAVLRRRFLSKYNFIIAPKYSPYNTNEGYNLGERFMGAILRGEKTFEDFVIEFEKLPKNRMDI